MEVTCMCVRCRCTRAKHCGVGLGLIVEDTPSCNVFIVLFCAAGSLTIGEGSACEKLHAVLKDLASTLQALGRLAEHFIDDFYESRLSEAQLLMKKFCMLANYSAKLQLFNVTTPIPEILDHDFIEL